jgi:hypothetical protein
MSFSLSELTSNSEVKSYSYALGPSLFVSAETAEGKCPRLSNPEKNMSRFALAEMDGWNLYAIVGNDPVGAWDYLGRAGYAYNEYVEKHVKIENAEVPDFDTLPKGGVGQTRHPGPCGYSTKGKGGT